MNATTDARPSHLWTMVAVAVSLPLLLVLCLTVWRSPYPLSEAVGLFEDVGKRPASSFLTPTTSYYRPLFYVALSGLWHGAPSIGSALNSIKLLLHIAPLALLVLLFLWHLRSRTPLDVAAATVAVAVLVGSPGLLGNLELPLSYTIVGMPIALLVWMLLERDRRSWHGPAIVGLTLIAIGFKEQGLVLVPLVLAAWWMGAPGVGRVTAVVIAGIAAAYVGFRLVYLDGSNPLFEQDIGFGFGVLSRDDAEARFGGFPLWIYAYNAVGTMASVLFAEPTEGVFRIVRRFAERQPQPWHIVYLFSSFALTGLIAWWGIGTLRGAGGRRWSPEARLFVATIVVLGASGVLSFAYSRDRLGGMAVPFYALAAFYAVRAVAARAAQASRAIAAVTATVLLLLAVAWQFRALYTIEFSRQRAMNAHREWITDLHERRVEYAHRAEYLRIMEGMLEQGAAPDPIQRTQYPRWMVLMLGEY